MRTVGRVTDRAGAVPVSTDAATAHPGEQQREGSLASRSNWLRAGVLGANDGIISTAGVVVGVAGATSSQAPVLLAGVAAVVAGALSMGGGEYVSVSTQRDTEAAALALERWELEHLPEQELAELAALYERRGLSAPVALQVARELTDRDALAAHAEVELGIDAYERTSPWQAAASSVVAFTLGALLPLLAIALPPPSWRLGVTVVAVVVALAVTGAVSARLGRSPVGRAVARNVGVGGLAMGVTHAVGVLAGGVIG